MSFRPIVIAAAISVLSFAGGFLVANSLNRSAIAELTAENERLRSGAPSTGAETGATLSNEEILASIAQADRDPDNAALQRNLGLALYRYGVIKSDGRIITESSRLLERASKLAPDDLDLMIGLGNAYFDIGYLNRDGTALARAREIYLNVLAKRPDDVDVRTDLGVTYFLDSPPDDGRAISEFRAVLARKPDHKKALEFIVQALSRQGETTEAEKLRERLMDTAPNKTPDLSTPAGEPPARPSGSE